MSDTPGKTGREGPQRPPGPGHPPRGGASAAPLGAHPAARMRRPSLWLLLVPAVLYCAAPLVANRIEPRVLGVPFLLAWIIAATVLSPIVIWAAARFDPAYRSDALEPIPADRPAGTEGSGIPRGPAGGAR